MIQLLITVEYTVSSPPLSRTETPGIVLGIFGRGLPPGSPKPDHI